MNKTQIEIFREFEDDSDMLLWQVEGDNVTFFVNVSDVFLWGGADAEAVETMEDVELLKQCRKDCEKHMFMLYAARKRKLRPQGAIYCMFTKEEADLFNKCGPYRERGFGNPKENKN